ncbi:MAG: hypothetical protein FJZ90_05850 [Chloroflexi bacterium]|nr:hypothetical protein [Chloroflexota bacterium]
MGSAPSAQGRSLALNAYRAWIQAGREEAQSVAFRRAYRRRSPLEGTISECVRGQGLRYARYRGLAKLRLQVCFTAVAVNLKRLMRWLARGAQPALGVAA